MNVAFIPVRGGSKSIPLKNIKKINGRPLVYWVTKAACECSYIDVVYISSDSTEILKTVETFKSNCSNTFGKVRAIERSAATASDTASTESAMLEFAEGYDFDNIVLIQATSPLLKKDDLERGFEEFYEEGTDSVFSVVRQKRFNWKTDGEGYAHPENYDVYNRPRRQDFEGYLVENGAFYITSKESLLKSKNRISGNIKAVEMSEDSFYEIDEPDDWAVIEALMKKGGTGEDFIIPEIKMFLTDCDGCLTDGGMYYSEKGDELKKFNTRDGMGIGMLRREGIITGIITSEDVDLNRRRAEKLKLDVLISGCFDKKTEIERLCSEYGIEPQNVCYIGDDVNDLDAISSVGFGCCPADAIDAVKKQALYIAEAKGGEGVIREIAEICIKSNNGYK